MLEKTIELKNKYKSEIERLQIKIEVLDELYNELVVIREPEEEETVEQEETQVVYGDMGSTEHINNEENI